VSSQLRTPEASPLRLNSYHRRVQDLERREQVRRRDRPTAQLHRLAGCQGCADPFHHPPQRRRSHRKGCRGPSRAPGMRTQPALRGSARATQLPLHLAQRRQPRDLPYPAARRGTAARGGSPRVIPWHRTLCNHASGPVQAAQPPASAVEFAFGVQASVQFPGPRQRSAGAGHRSRPPCSIG
jgi:hypothetical protein